MEDIPLRTIVERVAENAREALLRDGQHMTILLLFGEEKTAVVALAIPLGDPGKERQATFRDVGSKVGEAYGPHLGPLVSVVHISEAWGRELDSGEEREYQYLENDPQRNEVLVVTGYRPATNETIMYIFDMQRDVDGNLTAVEPHIPEGATVDKVEAPLLEAFCMGFIAGALASQS